MLILDEHLVDILPLRSGSLALHWSEIMVLIDE